MKRNCLFFTIIFLFASTYTAHSLEIERVFRPARVTRGNTNVIRIQPIDEAAWLWISGDNGLTEKGDETPHSKSVAKGKVKFLKFKNEFEVAQGDGELSFDVSADERFYLTIDGQFVARGPNRAAVENWQYQTYRIKDLKPGKHIIEAVVWKTGDHGPLAQLSHRGGFALKAEGVYDAKLTTGKGVWQVGWIEGIKPIGFANKVWGTGSQFEITGRGPYAVNPEKWSTTVIVRKPVKWTGPDMWGLRMGGWMLYPTQLPDQTEDKISVGTVKAVARTTKWREEHIFTKAEMEDSLVEKFNNFFKNGGELIIPANTKLQLAVDLGVYTCAYPILRMKGAKGARVAWTWTESARSADKRRKANRSEIIGKFLEGYGDDFISDGEEGEFSSPWFRCGRWCRIDIETLGEDLVLKDMYLIESRYPVELESTFEAKADARFAEIRKICARAMQMCCHEMLFDCPYYEQQMYPGDSRVELLVLAAMSRDDRIIKRAIEIFELATRDDGSCPMNFPTRGIQESYTYTLCYLLMYGDYLAHGSDYEWLRARIPGMRKSMSGVEYYENDEGLLQNLPGWSFMDWAVDWPNQGTAPDSRFGFGMSIEMNLFWVLAMQSAANVEMAFGNDLQAQYWLNKCEKLKKKIVEKFWCEKRGLLSDTPAMKYFSEHAQALAIIGDVLPEDKRERAFKHLIEDKDLSRCTVYFSYYLFEAYFKMGRADLFLKRLDMWRGYVDLGVTTLLEKPENENIESRSDCHAWGAHPIWFMQTGLAGIKSGAAFFKKVYIAPNPGSLSEIKSSHPHPNGWVKVDLKFNGDKVSGEVYTPVEGEFEYKGFKQVLTKGKNIIVAQ